MRKVFLLSLYLLMLPFSIAAQTCDWSELIGKKMVLYRYGRLQDGIFTEYVFTNPAGEKPVEQFVLVDSTHFEWKYALTGDFEHECRLNGNVMEINPPFFNNRHLNIVKRIGNVVVTDGHDGITRAFFIQESQPAPEALPASVGSTNGFCDGKLDDLLSHFTDLTYNSATPMGRHFLFSMPADDEVKKWLESTDETFRSAGGAMAVVKPMDVNLYPNGKPVVADVNLKRVLDSYLVAMLADMAYQYPEFIRSIIHQESADSFRVDMFDPMGRPIVVRVSNRVLVRDDGSPIYCVGKDGQYNWATILEKAAVKWIIAFQHVIDIAGWKAELMAPMFTGDGRSFCIKPGSLSAEDLARVITTCLDNGMMVTGSFLKSDVTLDGHTTAADHGHSFLPPQKSGALYSIRNPKGNGDDDHIMNVMSSDSDVPPLIDLRIISPGAAAKYFRK